MMVFSENELVLPALYIISNNPGISMGELINEMGELLNPKGEDLDILTGRSDNKFSQKVRNLKSHDTLTRDGFVTLAEGKSRRTGGLFTITGEGQYFLESHKEDFEILLRGGYKYEDVVSSINRISNSNNEASQPQDRIIDENIVILEGGKIVTQTESYRRSNKLREAAIKHYSDHNGNILCSSCGFDFFKVYGELGKGFIEVHHEEPLFEMDGKDKKKGLVEALSKVKPLCANCHRMIHRQRANFLAVDELKKIIEDNAKIAK